MRLDVGVGGNKTFGEHPVNSDVAIDILKPTHKRSNFILASGEALPFRDKAFSLAVSLDVIEHVDSPLRFISEMKRCATKILLLTPNALHLTNVLMSAVSHEQKHQPFPDHIAVWSKAEMENLLRRIGFTEFSFFFTNEGRHTPRWYSRILLMLCPFPSLRYGALGVIAS
jgi:SAM-dependent methyltransferase